MLVDETTIHVKAGDGGPGSASVRREAHVPRGGPDGGNGGRGGDVVLEVDPAVSDLGWLADHPRQRAASGGPGRGAKRTGADAGDLVLAVPDGTVAMDERGVIADLVGPGATAVVARGGRGGRGSATLASARNRVPRVAEGGEPGEEADLRLELRLVADVGLLGLPNAGKSTLLSRLTAARPKVADYPFTTLSPNLGVAGEGDDRVVVADVPGLIEGAHEGRGLGLAFLRHVRRTRVLVYVVDLSSPDPGSDLETVRREIAAFDPDLEARRSIIAGTKADLAPSIELPTGFDLAVSGLTGQGIDELRDRIDREVALAKREEPPRQPYVVLRPGREAFVVRREGDRFRVSGPRVERWVAEVDLDDEKQVAALQRRLVRSGVERRLAEAGARRGDEVLIGGVAFEFVPEGNDGRTA